MGASVAASRGAPVPVPLPLALLRESSARLDGEPVTLLSLGKNKQVVPEKDFGLFMFSRQQVHKQSPGSLCFSVPKKKEFNEQSVLLLRCSLTWTRRNKYKRVQASSLIMSAVMLP